VASKPTTLSDPTGECPYADWGRWQRWLEEHELYLSMVEKKETCWCKCILTATFPEKKDFVLVVSPVYHRAPENRASTCVCGDHAACTKKCDPYAREKLAKLLRDRDKGRAKTFHVPTDYRNRHREPNPDKDSDWTEQPIPAGDPTNINVEGKCEYTGK
jgi:hypothetical protein